MNETLLIVCSALLLVFGAFSKLAEHNLGEIPTDDWVRFAALQIVLAPLAGGIVGWAGGRLIDHASARDWVEPAFQRLSMPAIALLGYALAEAIGGNGFIGAFVAGFMLVVKDLEVREHMQAFGEADVHSLRRSRGL